MGSVVGPLWILEDGYSMEFDGTDDYIDCGSFTPLDSGTALTISAWFKSSTYTTAGVLISVNKHVDIYQGSSAYSNTKGRFTYRLKGAYGNSFKTLGGVEVSPPGTGAGDLVDGNWHHLCFVWDDATTTAVVYEDGVAVITDTSTTGTLNSVTEDLWISKGVWGGASVIQGNIDEVSIWDSALSPTDVASVYNLGAPTNLTPFNPLVWYRMGDNGVFKDPQWLLPENSNKDKVSNYSLEFDGTNDYVSCGNVTALNGSAVATWAGWVKPENASTGESPFSQYGTGSDEQFSWFVTDSRARIDVFMNGNVVFRASGGSDLLDADVWNFVAITYNKANVAADEVKVYVGKGGSITRVTETGGFTGDNAVLYSTTSDFLIGSMDEGSPARFWEGNVDNVSIWDAELDLSTITSLYNSGTPNDLRVAASYTAGGGTDKSGDLQGYWRIGENGTYKYPQWLLPNNENKDKESNYSLLFDGGDDSITTGLDCSSATHPSITVSCWLKYPVEPPYHYGLYYAAGVQSADGVYQGLGLMNGGRISYKANDIWVQGTNLRDNLWHNVIWVCEYNTPSAGNMTINVYLDGNTTPDISTIDTSGGQLTGNLFIGSYDGTTGYFDGNIDEVAMWGSALTTADVTTIWNSGTPSDLSNLSPLGYWKMGDLTYSAGTADIWVVPDSSINNNTGFADNMTLDTRVGDAPNSINNALSLNMEIIDRRGDAPNSSGNTVSYNMELNDRVNDTPG